VFLLFQSGGVLSVTWSMDHGKQAYNAASTVEAMELLKLIIASLCYAGERMLGKQDGVEWVALGKMSLLYMLPAALYTASNNLWFGAQLYLNPGEFNLLTNSRIIITTLLWWLVFKKIISVRQWLAMVLLTVVCGLSQADKVVLDLNRFLHSAVFKGTVLCFLGQLATSLASVYSELLLKKDHGVSLNLQNSLLYLWGALINAGLLLYQLWDPWMKSDAALFAAISKGWDYRTVVVVLVNALKGLSISAVLKYVDNIAYIFGNAAATYIIAGAAFLLFGTTESNAFIVALVLYAFTVHLYYSENLIPPALQRLLKKDEQIISNPSSSA